MAKQTEPVKQEICILDCSNWKDRNSFYDDIRSKLDLPAYFGRNLDALYDILTERRKQFVLIHGRCPQESMPQYFEKILQVMADAGALKGLYKDEIL